MVVECSWTFHVVDRSEQIGQHCLPINLIRYKLSAVYVVLAAFLKCMVKQRENRGCILLLAWVLIEILGGSGLIFCSFDVDHFDFFTLVLLSPFSFNLKSILQLNSC